MNTYFLCLANSYKHDNRCLAGVEVQRNTSGFALIKDDWGHPIWFRPISKQLDTGAIPNEEALSIALFDVVEATDISRCPDGAQVENHYYKTLSVVDHMEPTTSVLDELSKTNRRVLFGNTFSSISHEQYESLDYSILMIKATHVRCYLKERTDKQPQPRIKFEYRNIQYDFPVTDPDFRHMMESNLEKVNSSDTYYLALSLGIICEDKHYKLVAGVIQSFSEQSNPVMADIPVSARETFMLFQQGLSVDQIAQHRGMTLSTISSHLVPFISKGLIDIHNMVSYDAFCKVRSYQINHPDEDKLKPYYEAFNGEISYEDIRFILASL